MQPAATFGPLSPRSGLYRQPYQRLEVGIGPKPDLHRPGIDRNRI
jgi:hypothetical protein